MWRRGVVVVASLCAACGGPDLQPIDAPASSSELTSFAFLTADNPGLASNVMGTINATSITLTAPIGTSPAGLVARFTTSGVGVAVNGAVQMNGVTANDFSSTLTYVVSAADSSTTSYTVALTVHGTSAPVDISAGMQPEALEIADIDGDGKRDIAVAEFSGTRGLEVALNTTVPGATMPSFAGPRAFALTSGSSAYDVAIADFNVDGKPDVALAGAGVFAAVNTSQPDALSFATAVNTGLIGFTVTAGDLNGDQKPDLVTAKAGAADIVEVTLNTTSAGSTTLTFSPKVQLATGAGPTSVAIADLNGDGQPDLAVSNNNVGTVSVFLSTTAPGATTPSFASKVDVAAQGLARRVLIADMNGDGKPDLVVINNDRATVSILLNTTATGAMAPSFMPQATFATADCPTGLTVADFNEDGRPDVLTATKMCPGGVVLLVNLTPMGAMTPTFAPMLVLAEAYDSPDVAVEDLDGDMHPDIAVTVPLAGTASGGHVSVMVSN